MKRNTNPVGTGLQWCGAVCLTVITLPLLAVAGFLLRGLLLVAAITAIISGAVCYRLNPRFHAWLDQQMRARH